MIPKCVESSIITETLLCLISLQYFFVREKLYIVNKFTENAICGIILLARYINASIALRYGTYGPKSYLLSSQGRNISFFTSSDQCPLH